MPWIDEVMNEKQPLGSHKLTKKFFASLPAGVYVVSNCYDTLGPGRATPVFNEYVVPEEERKSQWDRIKAACADQRLCDVYRSVEDCKRVVQSRTAQSPGYPSILIFERDKNASSMSHSPCAAHMSFGILKIRPLNRTPSDGWRISLPHGQRTTSPERLISWHIQRNAASKELLPLLSEAYTQNTP